MTTSRSAIDSFVAFWFVTMIVVSASLTGCATLRHALIGGEDRRSVLELGRIEGRIDSAARGSGPLVIVLAEQDEAESRAPIGIDAFVRSGPGRFAFDVRPGRYILAAFEDRNESGRIDPGERRWPRQGAPPLLDVPPAHVMRQDILLDSDAKTRAGEMSTETLDVLSRPPGDRPSSSPWARSAEGTICPDLHDARFGQEAAMRGVLEPMAFLQEGLAGVYFLAPYDPTRIPVLFVHGLAGSPEQLSSLMGSLAQERFQPWFYFYPSGFSLDGVSEHLARSLARLEVAYDLNEIAIVAHSMGALIARGAILRHPEGDRVRLLITLAAPWGGAERAPTTLPINLPPSFADMNPSSAYLRWLFYAEDGRARGLPEQTPLHVLISFRMKVLARIANDGSVSVASQTRDEAQREAASMRAFDVTHEEILTSPEAIGRVNELLEERFRGPAAEH